MKTRSTNSPRSSVTERGEGSEWCLTAYQRPLLVVRVCGCRGTRLPPALVCVSRASEMQCNQKCRQLPLLLRRAHPLPRSPESTLKAVVVSPHIYKWPLHIGEKKYWTKTKHYKETMYDSNLFLQLITRPSEEGCCSVYSVSCSSLTEPTEKLYHYFREKSVAAFRRSHYVDTWLLPTGAKAFCLQSAHSEQNKSIYLHVLLCSQRLFLSGAGLITNQHWQAEVVTNSHALWMQNLFLMLQSQQGDLYFPVFFLHAEIFGTRQSNIYECWSRKKGKQTIKTTQSLIYLAAHFAQWSSEREWERNNCKTTEKYLNKIPRNHTY